ncbi:MAG: LamG domain-containing protein [Planctomycetota bacterium]
MGKKLNFLFSLIVTLGLAANASADLVAHWSLDDGSGSVATDFTGNGHDGTVGGTANWVVGKIGGALDFNGTSTYIDMDDEVVRGTWSLTMWLKPRDIPYTTDYYAVMHTDAWGGGAMHLHLRATTSLLNADFNSGPDVTSTTVLQADEWYHAVVTVTDEGAGGSKMYINGVLENEGTGGSGGDYLGPLNFGAWTNTSRYYHGIMDDIRIYDHVLSDVEVLGAMEGEPWPYAFGPKPDDGATHADTWVTLSWTPGGYAVSHDVYLGDNFEDVDAGTGDTFRGNQVSTFYVAGFPGFAYPEGLVPGTTYYWRIDEVNEAEPNSPWKGDVWSFSVPPKTAYNPNPADGAEFVDTGATLSWTGGFGAKLHTVYIGTDFDNVSNATGGAPQGSATYKPGTLESEKVYYWRVDEFDAVTTHKGAIWSFTTPGAAGNPQPSNRATGVQMTAQLGWTPATTAVSHDLYFGTDKDAARNATTASPEFKGNKALGAESYDPGKLAWHSDYYWRVDAVYNTGSVKGLVWSFTTADFLLVDDFESYNDIDPPDPASNRIFESWIDGFGTTDNGALVGNEMPPYAEQTIVHGGAQSIPYAYDNNLKTSEATLTLVSPRDWTEEGVAGLSLWFRGASANAAERMYVALNGNAVVYHDDPAATQKGGWNQWVIDLQAFADQGVGLTNVNTITIGIGTKNSPAAGGSGQMYFDDIRLYRPATAP